MIATGAHAAAWESLIMPGPLSEAHLELEEECSACHTAFSQIEQNQLCRDCHEDVAADVEESTGFHGKHPDIPTMECRACHSDHLGRDVDITGLVAETFDHSVTDFPLEGSHVIQACNECHTASASAPETPAVPAAPEKFRDAPSQCIACHETHDVHGGRLGEACQECHEPSRWLESSFDHQETTDYPLLGAHGQQSCGTCHIDQQYENTSSSCVDCHGLDDVHQGSRGNTCQDCHSAEDWKTTAFEHLQQTGFELEGSHSKLTCNACHLDNMSLATPPTACLDCHSSNDVHQGARGTECAECHNNQDWKIDFNHAEKSGFTLLGGHQQLRCEQCHTGALTDSLPDTCEQCHDGDDPHNGTLGACDSCHSSQSWTQSVRFDHEFTAMPLFGLHRLATCEQCHLSQQFDQTDIACVDCHQQDDPHGGTFDQACEACHNPGGWDLWHFEHDTQTTFTLSGSHENMACAACHSSNTGAAGNLSQRCRDCHLVDDAHNGQFGDRCDRCHTTESFKDSVRFR